MHTYEYLTYVYICVFVYLWVTYIPAQGQLIKKEPWQQKRRNIYRIFISVHI
jgi:hypothetical protein